MFGQDKRLQPSEISQMQKEIHKQEAQFVLPGRPAGLPQYQRTPVMMMQADGPRGQDRQQVDTAYGRVDSLTYAQNALSLHGMQSSTDAPNSFQNQIVQ